VPDNNQFDYNIIGPFRAGLFGHSAPNKVNLWGRIKQIVLLKTTGIETHKIGLQHPAFCAGRHYTIVL
jgi:hypothetical protein